MLKYEKTYEKKIEKNKQKTEICSKKIMQGFS